ncbi:MAG: tetratricopeptide repeat protein [Spartobacteria bacterium]
MKIAHRANGVVAFALIITSAVAQNQPVRRARPAEDPPVARALPPDAPEPNERSTSSSAESAEPSAAPTEPPAQRQLEYAEGLFHQKLYDLAIPEYEKYIDQYPNGSGRATAYFFLGESYRALNKNSPARKAFQAVLDNYPESDFAGPAAYVLGETAFNEKNFGAALPLFHRAAAKSKEPSIALSARYFEARCFEALDKKDEACGIYLQVIDAKGANPYRDDCRYAAASILFSRGKKIDALKQYEALANEAQKPALKAEAAVRGGVIAVDLVQAEKGKVDKGIIDKAASLLQKGRTMPEAGKFRAIAQVGYLRLQYYSGQYAQLLVDYKKEQQKIPEEARAEVMLLVANAERQLNHAREAGVIYDEIIAKYPSRDEAKDAQYQRLINIYNSDPGHLLVAVDEFLKTNPTAERADQAKLLKAEALYKQKAWADAAPIYAELRVGQLSPKLRAEAAYKLGSCQLQLKDENGIIEAFTYYVQAYPDNAQAPSAFAQRALVYEQAKNYDAALADLNTILSKYPQAREREAALQQKALVLGQQENRKGMSDTFRQLLKEYPKSSVAAQAQYYIGKAAFETKDFKAAILLLNAARQLNKEQYYNPATVRIISSYFGLRDRPAVTKEVDNFMTAPNATVPPEILEWLGIEYYNEKNYRAAEKYLSALGKIDNPPNIKPDFWFYLGDAAIKLQNFPEAEEAYGKYLQTATDPAGKAKVLLALGAAKVGAHKADDAQKIAEEIMRLQPEGRVNAEARLLAGEVQIERGNFDEAGKAFMGVALLYDDPAVTPRALQKAASAYQRAGKGSEADRAAKQLHDKYPNYVGG